MLESLTILVYIGALILWFWGSIVSYVNKKLQKKNFSIELNWKPPVTVGQTVSFRVWILKEAKDPVIIQRIVDDLSVEIKHRENVVPAIKEIIFPSAENKLAALEFKFSAKISGEYFIKVHHQRRNIPDSPMKVEFLPSSVDPSKTSFLRASPFITGVLGVAQDLEIQPNDRFDNKCRVKDVSFDAFEFSCRMADDGLNNNKNMIDFVSYNFEESYLDRVKLRVRFYVSGVFNAKILYKGKDIHKGEFTMIVMSKEDHMNFTRIINSESPSWKAFEGKLLARGSEIQKNIRTVYLYVSPTILYVREYFLKVFPIRVANFRLSTATKVDILIMNCDDDTYTFTITDKIQPNVTVEMSAGTARIVLGMFSHYLGRKIGGLESFESKQRIFYKNVREANLDIRLTTKTVKINRQDIIDSSYRTTKSFRSRDWCKSFRIEFKNEPGIDNGGLRREWLNCLAGALFENKSNGLFASLGNSRLVHPNCSSNRDPLYTLKYYELAGHVVGKCIFETSCGSSHQQMINGRFSRSFLAIILGLPTSYKYFELDDPEFYLGKIKFILQNDVDSMELTFSEEEYNSHGKLLKVVDLIPNGAKILVTNENKEEYLNLLANYRLAIKVHDECEAFLKALHEIIPDDLLTNFDENELELLLCGTSQFDVDDLRKNCQTASWNWDTNSRKILDWFWTAVENMDDDEKRRLLQFTTGSSLLPHGGFKSLDPKFNICFSGRVGSLPTAQTCVNRICLPDHYSFELFENNLKMAVNEGNEGFGFA